jgi:hypothetical protein
LHAQVPWECLRSTGASVISLAGLLPRAASRSGALQALPSGCRAARTHRMSASSAYRVAGGGSSSSRRNRTRQAPQAALPHRPRPGLKRSNGSGFMPNLLAASRNPCRSGSAQGPHISRGTPSRRHPCEGRRSSRGGAALLPRSVFASAQAFLFSYRRSCLYFKVYRQALGRAWHFNYFRRVDGPTTGTTSAAPGWCAARRD